MWTNIKKNYKYDYVKVTISTRLSYTALFFPLYCEDNAILILAQVSYTAPERSLTVLFIFNTPPYHTGLLMVCYSNFRVFCSMDNMCFCASTFPAGAKSYKHLHTGTAWLDAGTLETTCKFVSFISSDCMYYTRINWLSISTTRPSIDQSTQLFAPSSRQVIRF